MSRCQCVQIPPTFLHASQFPSFSHQKALPPSSSVSAALPASFPLRRSPADICSSSSLSPQPAPLSPFFHLPPSTPVPEFRTAPQLRQGRKAQTLFALPLIYFTLPSPFFLAVCDDREWLAERVNPLICNPFGKPRKGVFMRVLLKSW